MAKKQAPIELEAALKSYWGRKKWRLKSYQTTENEYIAKVYADDRPVPEPDDEDAEPPYHCVMNRRTGHLGCYSNDWFERLTMDHWIEHVQPLSKRIKRYLEIGVCEGRSLRWVMENTSCKRADGVDPYQPGRRKQARAFRRYERNMKKNIAPWLDENSERQVKLFKQESHRWLVSPRQPPEETYDFIYVDGDHRGHMAMQDLVLSFQKLKVGGIMACDDINRRWAHSQPATWEAWTGFHLAYSHLCEILYQTRKSVLIQKLYQSNG